MLLEIEAASVHYNKVAALKSATNTSPIAAQNRALRSVRRVTMMMPTVAACVPDPAVPNCASSNLR